MAVKDQLSGPVLLDRFGVPIDRSALKDRLASANLIGARQAVREGMAAGLTPSRLAALMREADQMMPEAYLELAEEIEERDLHYVGVLGTRKRQVSQLPISVSAGSKSAADKKIADAIQDDLIDSGVIDEYLFDMLDAVGKGFSVGELMWDTASSNNKWGISRIEHVDPRFIRWDLPTRRIPRLLANDGTRIPLAPYKFLFAQIKAKSGIPIRGGLTRCAAWGYLFKNYALKDWVQFAEVYGMPIRVGKYPPGTPQADQDALLEAVRCLGTDAAAIVPTNMLLEFVEAGGKTGSAELYEKLCQYIDNQMSKAALGQTGTTDSSGAKGLGSGTEHTQVREDIERSDAKAVCRAVGRDVLRPYVDLNFGPQPRYPTLGMGREDVKDATLMVSAAKDLAGMMDIRAQDIREAVGFTQPQQGDDLLRAPAAAPAAGGGNQLNHLLNSPSVAAAIAAAAGGQKDAIERAAKEQLSNWQEVMEPAVEQIRALAARCHSLAEFKTELAKLYPQLDMTVLADKLQSITFQALAAGADGHTLDPQHRHEIAAAIVPPPPPPQNITVNSPPITVNAPPVTVHVSMPGNRKGMRVTKRGEDGAILETEDIPADG